MATVSDKWQPRGVGRKSLGSISLHGTTLMSECFRFFMLVIFLISTGRWHLAQMHLVFSLVLEKVLKYGTGMMDNN